MSQTQVPRLASLTRVLCTVALATSVMLLGRPPTAAAATFTVTKTTDSKDGVCNSDCSLREAIIAAHQQAGSDTITLPTGTYRVTLSDLDLTSSLTIVGAGAASTIIESNGQDRVFEVRPDITVTIDKVTIRNGSTMNKVGNGAGILNDGTLTLSNSVVRDNVTQYENVGAGIYNTGALTISNSTISGNTSLESLGGGIYNQGGTVRLTNSSVSGNSGSPGSGGGIYNAAGTIALTNSTVGGNSAYVGGGIYNLDNMSLLNSTVRGNGARYDGGGIANSGTLTLTSSTISGNGADDNGAGIFNTGTLSITNSTVSDNTAQAYYSAGGGISNRGTLTIVSSTIANNRAEQQGGGGGIVNAAGASLTLSNTIIAGNTAGAGPPDCAGTLSSQGYNLIGNKTGCTITGDTTGNKLNVDPQLGPLQNNGGPTLTHLPGVAGPAIDAGNPATPGSGGSACPTTDQRDQPRPTDGNGNGTIRCDIGAVER